MLAVHQIRIARRDIRKVHGEAVDKALVQALRRDVRPVAHVIDLQMPAERRQLLVDRLFLGSRNIRTELQEHAVPDGHQ
ncbi:hypothetical protein D3C73_1561850 [compost metagenome]